MLLLKSLHVASAVIWLGNFVVTGVWSARAFGSRRDDLKAFAAREIIFTDVLFTLVFGTAVVVSGIALASIEGVAVWSTMWTRAALIVVIAAGVLWLGVMLPLEITMLRATAIARPMGRTFLAWNVVGWGLTLALFAVIFLMVQKPT